MKLLKLDLDTVSLFGFRSRNFDNKINRIHKRALTITYADKSSSFQDLRDRDKSVTIHHRNILQVKHAYLFKAFPHLF